MYIDSDYPREALGLIADKDPALFAQMDADDTKCRPDAEEGSRPTKSEARG